MNEPDIRVLVSNTGDASPSGESANLIRDNLQQAFSRSPVHAKIVDSTASTRKIRDNIVKSLQGITVNIKAELENVGSVKNSIAKSLTPDASIAKAYNKLLSLNGNKASPIFKQSLEDISEVLARDATLLQAFDSAIDQVNAKTLRSVVKELVAVKTGAQSSAQAVSNFRKLIDQQYQLRIEAPKIDDKIFGQVHALKSALSGIASQGGEVNGGQPQFAGRQVFDWIVDNGSIIEKQLFRVTEGFEAFQSVLRGLQVNSGNLIDYSTTLGLDTLNVDMDGLDHLLSTEHQVRTENARLLVSFEQLRNALPESAFQNGGLTVTLDELERIVSVCPVAQQYIDQLKQSLVGVVRVSDEANHQADGIFAQKPIVIDVSINQESIVQIRNAIIDGLKDIRIDVSGTGDGTSSTKGRRQRSALGVGIDYTEARKEQKRLADESERIANENRQKSKGFVTAIERIDISKIDRNKDYVAQKQAEMLADAKAFAERTDKIGEDELNAFEARIKEYQNLMQWYSDLAVQDSTKDYVADRTAKFNSQFDAMLRDVATIEDPEKQAELLEQLANMEGDVRKKLEDIGKTSGKVSPQMKQDVLDLVDAMHRLIQSYKDAQREAKAAAKKQTQDDNTKAKKQESAKEHNQNYVKNIRTNRLESSNEFWADKTDLPEYKRAKEILEDIDKLLEECTADTVKWVEWQKGQVSVLLRQLKLQEDAAKKRLDGDTKTTESMIEAKAGLADFEAYLKTLNPKVFTEMATKIDVIRSQFRQGIPSATKEARAAVKAFKADMKSLGYEGGNMLTYIGEKMKTFFTYLVSSTATMAVTNTLQQVYENVKSLDTAMTDLRIVTGETKDETKALLRSYNEMAQSLGTTTTEVSEGATDWLRQGYDAAESAELLRQSMTLSIVGEMESADATNALTSAMKGYQLSVEDAASVVDKFFRVDMSAATSSSELALALAKTAANAKLAGLSLDDVIGQLAVVNETMKESGEETGGTVRLAA